MELLNLKSYPSYLINESIDYIESIKDDSKMKMTSKLTLQKKSLLNCFILEDQKLYKIIEIIDIGPLNKLKWYSFFISNPTRKIEVYVESVFDKDILNKCFELKKTANNQDAFSLYHDD